MKLVGADAITVRWHETGEGFCDDNLARVAGSWNTVFGHLGTWQIQYDVQKCSVVKCRNSWREINYVDDE